MRKAPKVLLSIGMFFSVSSVFAMEAPVIERATVNNDKTNITVYLSSTMENGYIEYQRYGSGNGYDYSQMQYRADGKKSIVIDVGHNFSESGTSGTQTITLRSCVELHDATQSVSCGETYPLIITLDAPASFPDVPDSHPYADSINYVRSQGIVAGHPDGKFHPDSGINRAEFTKVITLALYGQEKVNMCGTLYSFSDVPKDAWYAKYICRARDGWLLTGYPDGTFRPAQNINFSEAAKILANGFGLIHHTESCNGKLCVDTNTPDHPWYEQYVRALTEKNAIPTSITRFDQPVTRGVMAEMVYRLHAVVTDKPTKTYEDLAGIRAMDTVQYRLLDLPTYTIENYARNTVYLYTITAPTTHAVTIGDQHFTISGGRWSGPQIAVFSDSSLSNQIDTLATNDNWTSSDTATLHSSLKIPAGQTRYMLLSVHVGTPADMGFSVRVQHDLLPEVMMRSSNN